jgi:hypothetical protein
LQLTPQKVLAHRPTRQESADATPEARRVGAGASSVSSVRVPPTTVVASVEQAEKGAREAPTEGTVCPGTIATP